MTESAMNLSDGRMRAVIERVTPSVDNGRFAAKRIVGDAVVVEADSVLTATSAVTFASTLNSSTGDANDLTITAATTNFRLSGESRRRTHQSAPVR